MSASAAYPYLWTYSSLTPSVGVSMTKYNNYVTGSDFGQASLSNITPVVSSIYGVLSYSSLEVWNLSVVPEGGRNAQLGAQVYLDGPSQIWKGLALDQEYFRFAKHTVISPSIKGTWVSSSSLNYPQSGAYLEGRNLSTLVSPFPSDGFNQLSIRGYPNFLSPSSRFAAVTALDLYLPDFPDLPGCRNQPLFSG